MFVGWVPQELEDQFTAQLRIGLEAVFGNRIGATESPTLPVWGRSDKEVRFGFGNLQPASEFTRGEPGRESIKGGFRHTTSNIKKKTRADLFDVEVLCDWGRSGFPCVRQLPGYEHSTP
jgi:hypothetical protein